MVESPKNKMSKPFLGGTNGGQFNDEYDMNAFEKTKRKHYIPRKVNYDTWEATPNIANLPSSCDDEMFDDYIITTVDLNMVKNAAANSLSALVSQVYDSKTEVTDANCLRVSLIRFIIGPYYHVPEQMCSLLMFPLILRYN
jgi:hypothetical protein